MVKIVRRINKDIDVGEFIHMYIIQMIIFIIACYICSCQAMEQKTSISSDVSGPFTLKTF